MKQRVDLYQRRFRGGAPLLSSGQIFRVLGVALVCLVAVSAWAQVDAFRTASQVTSLQGQQAQEAAALIELSTTHPPAAADPALEAAVERRGREREAKHRLLELLESQSLGNADGLSPFVEGLARQRIDGLWLRRIRVASGGGDVAIEGSSLSPELVPQLVQLLSGEDAFVGKDFRSLRMERSEEEPARIDFVLTTQLEEAP